MRRHCVALLQVACLGVSFDWSQSLCTVRGGVCDTVAPGDCDEDTETACFYAKGGRRPNVPGYDRQPGDCPKATVATPMGTIGESLGVAPAPSLAACAARCSSHLDCAGLSFDFAAKTCELRRANAACEAVAPGPCFQDVCYYLRVGGSLKDELWRELTGRYIMVMPTTQWHYVTITEGWWGNDAWQTWPLEWVDRATLRPDPMSYPYPNANENVTVVRDGAGGVAGLIGPLGERYDRVHAAATMGYDVVCGVCARRDPIPSPGTV